MNLTKRQTAILYSLFSFIGICGIGHFYLRKFKEGVIFLLGGIILEILFAVPIFVGLILVDENIEFQTFIDSWFIISGSILATLTISHILYITKKDLK